MFFKESNARNNKTITRILHIVSAFNMGGVKTWLIHVLRHIDSKSYQIDILAQKPKESYASENEIRSLGSRLIACPRRGKPWVISRRLARVLREYGPYDVIHCNVPHYTGGLALRVAARYQVPIRIVHSHDQRNSGVYHTRNRFVHQFYSCLRKYYTDKYATNCLAVSKAAGKCRFGPDWETDPRSGILHLGIDLNPFSAKFDRNAVRHELSIPSDVTVIGHVGRFAKSKNHDFLVEVVARILERNSKVWVLLVGEGKHKSATEEKARQLGILPRTTFAGPRDDIARVMKGAMDILLFPSLGEGLGIVVTEAQAAGLPCVISDTVPKEADIFPGLITRVGLEQSLKVWVDAVMNAISKGRGDPEKALKAVRQSPFNIENNIERLEKIYQG